MKNSSVLPKSMKRKGSVPSVLSSGQADIPKSEQILTTKSDNFCLKRQISHDTITLSIILTTEILSLFCHWCNKLNGFIIIKNAFYGAQRSPFCFRTAAFRSQRPPIF